MLRIGKGTLSTYPIVSKVVTERSTSYLLNTFLGCLALRRQKMKTMPARTSSATPPTTPPAIAPARALVDRTYSEPFANADEDSVVNGDSDADAWHGVVTDTERKVASGSKEGDTVG